MWSHLQNFLQIQILKVNTCYLSTVHEWIFLIHMLPSPWPARPDYQVCRLVITCDLESAWLVLMSLSDLSNSLWKTLWTQKYEKISRCHTRHQKVYCTPWMIYWYVSTPSWRMSSVVRAILLNVSNRFGTRLGNRGWRSFWFSPCNKWYHPRVSDWGRATRNLFHYQYDRHTKRSDWKHAENTPNCEDFDCQCRWVALYISRGCHRLDE